MNTLSSTSWRRKGSSVIFDPKTLGDLISEGAVISLREALGWMGKFPDNPPGRSLLVSGLEAVVENLPALEAHQFLAGKVRPFLLESQSRWSQCGVIFGFSAHTKAFVETSVEEEVLLRVRGRDTVRLSDGLWDGGASQNLRRIIREETGTEIPVGYHVARIS